MKRTIIFADHLNNSKDLYDHAIKYFRGRHKLVSYKINQKRLNKINKLLYFWSLIKKIGIVNFIYLISTKNSILITDQGSNFQSLISKNIIYLNHGWGVKRQLGKNEEKIPSLVERYGNVLKNTKYIFCLSDFDSTYFLQNECYAGIRRPEFIPLGSPRNDYLVKNCSDPYIRTKILESLSIKDESAKLYLYCPTHREDPDLDERFISKTTAELIGLNGKIDKNSYVIYKPHFLTEGRIGELKDLDNLRIIERDMELDIRDLMIASDILITDYSSIFVDYILLNKPVIFNTFDLEEYRKFRGLVIDYENPIHTPGPKINDLTDILNLNENEYKYNITESLNFFHKNSDSNSSKRIIEFIETKMLK